jgi:hypothetical protein
MPFFEQLQYSKTSFSSAQSHDWLHLETFRKQPFFPYGLAVVASIIFSSILH